MCPETKLLEPGKSEMDAAWLMSELQVESQKNLATHLLLTYYSLGTLKNSLHDLPAWGAGLSKLWDEVR